ncbi:MAG: hypothetical protein KAQ64_00275 [Candidatus Pacebacteria bacterium]|nr:hypothetical protein [Candidatus Paceibacterota bacterium]
MKITVFLLRRFGKFIWSWQKNITGKKLMLIQTINEIHNRIIKIVDEKINE